ncbi:hypothetical protein [Modicisalibacter xianhensis]|uniref:ATPase n=1 Tax=Modicisalibacter xianhensis TaxID=442341 RepID=A0A1I2ZYT0_9GAMM|nr:hypothetical protein [Halomonas xianhensis]SFH42997.1 hypothetical protein SAMN04487959_10425 [Halomonas xianhensis]
MAVETIQDVLELTRQLHANLANMLGRASREAQQERLRMLLDYLSLHERELSRVVALSEDDAQAASIHTWCTDYFDKHPFDPEALERIDYANMSTVGVMRSLLAIHDRIIDLYRYLATHAEVPSVEELLNSLLALEQHEAMRMVRDAEELEDL